MSVTLGQGTFKLSRLFDGDRGRSTPPSHPIGVVLAIGLHTVSAVWIRHHSVVCVAWSPFRDQVSCMGGLLAAGHALDIMPSVSSRPVRLVYKLRDIRGSCPLTSAPRKVSYMLIIMTVMRASTATVSKRFPCRLGLVIDLQARSLPRWAGTQVGSKICPFPPLFPPAPSRTEADVILLTMADTLWAPWRFSYVKGSDESQQAGCIFVELPKQADDRANLILHRGRTVFVMLNAFPYSSGHLMVVPFKHTGSMAELDDAELLEINQLVQKATGWLEAAYHPDGFNIGVNIGKAGGAGIPDHLHWHVVPRWNGDTNFMTSIAEVRVLPQSLDATYSLLKSQIDRETGLAY